MAVHNLATAVITIQTSAAVAGCVGGKVAVVNDDPVGAAKDAAAAVAGRQIISYNAVADNR